MDRVTRADPAIRAFRPCTMSPRCSACMNARDVNPAVADDIRQVMEAVRRLGSARHDAEDPVDSHVLLAGYGRGLH